MKMYLATTKCQPYLDLQTSPGKVRKEESTRIKFLALMILGSSGKAAVIVREMANCQKQ